MTYWDRYMTRTCPPEKYYGLKAREMHEYCWKHNAAAMKKCDKLSDVEAYEKCKDDADRVVAKCMDHVCSLEMIVPSE